MLERSPNFSWRPKGCHIKHQRMRIWKVAFLKYYFSFLHIDLKVAKILNLLAYKAIFYMRCCV